MQALVWWPFGLAWVRIVVALLVVHLPITATMVALKLDVPEWVIAAGLGMALVVGLIAAPVGVARARSGTVPSWAMVDQHRHVSFSRTLWAAFGVWLGRPCARVVRTPAARAGAAADGGRHRADLHAVVLPRRDHARHPGPQPGPGGDGPGILRRHGRGPSSAGLEYVGAGALRAVVVRRDPTGDDRGDGRGQAPRRGRDDAADLGAGIRPRRDRSVRVRESSAYRHDGQRRDRRPQSTIKVIAAIAIAAVLLVMLTWKRMVESLMLEVIGREWVVKVMVFTGLFLGLNMAVLGLYVFVHPEYHDEVRAAMPWVVTVLACLKFVLGAVAIRGPPSQAAGRGPDAADAGRGVADVVRDPLRNAGLAGTFERGARVHAGPGGAFADAAGPPVGDAAGAGLEPASLSLERILNEIRRPPGIMNGAWLADPGTNMTVEAIRGVVGRLRRAAAAQTASGLTDGALLDRFIGQRDQAAFEDLVRRHGPMVLGVCRRVLGDRPDVEDAFQAIFLVLVQKAPSIVPRDMVGNWLHGVAYRTAVRVRAGNLHRQHRERQMATVPEPAATQQGWDDLRPLLDEELGRLPPRYRSVLVLCDMEGRTRKDAARHLRCPEGTVSTWLARGRALLARRLTRRGVALGVSALATLLSEHASASVPAALVDSTTRCALAALAGTAAKGAGLLATTSAAGEIPRSVSVIANGMMGAMAMNKTVVLAGWAVAAATRVGLARRCRLLPPRGSGPGHRREQAVTGERARDGRVPGQPTWRQQLRTTRGRRECSFEDGRKGVSRR